MWNVSMQFCANPSGHGKIMFLLDPSKCFCSSPHPFLYHVLAICPSAVTVISWCLHNKRISCQTSPRQNSWKPAPRVTCGTVNCFSITILTKQIRCPTWSFLVFFLVNSFCWGFCLFPALMLLLSLSPPVPEQNLGAKRAEDRLVSIPVTGADAAFPFSFIAPALSHSVKNTEFCPGRFYSHWAWCWRALREDLPYFQQIFFSSF